MTDAMRYARNRLIRQGHPRWIREQWIQKRIKKRIEAIWNARINDMAECVSLSQGLYERAVYGQPVTIIEPENPSLH